MRWFSIRKSKIRPELRESLEQLGATLVQISVGGSGFIYFQGKQVNAVFLITEILPLLTEQYDRAELKETWLITMEAAITVFVGFETIHLVMQLIGIAR